jgi:hypothetical protein
VVQELITNRQMRPGCSTTRAIRKVVTAAALNAASAQRDAALCQAAVDVAAEAIEAELKPAIEAMLRVEVRVQALRHALWLAGNRAAGSIPSAPGAAGRIVDLIVAVKREARVERDNAVGEAFLNALGLDPMDAEGAPSTPGGGRRSRDDYFVTERAGK